MWFLSSWIPPCALVMDAGDHDPVIVVVPFPLHVTPGEGLPDSVQVLPPVTRRGEAENVSVTAVQVSVMPCDVDGGLGNDAVPLALTAKVIVRPETGTVVVPDWEFVHTSVPGATLSVHCRLHPRSP